MLPYNRLQTSHVGGFRASETRTVAILLTGMAGFISGMDLCYM